MAVDRTTFETYVMTTCLRHSSSYGTQVFVCMHVIDSFPAVTSLNKTNVFIQVISVFMFACVPVSSCQSPHQSDRTVLTWGFTYACLLCSHFAIDCTDLFVRARAAVMWPSKGSLWGVTGDVPVSSCYFYLLSLASSKQKYSRGISHWPSHCSLCN